MSARDASTDALDAALLKRLQAGFEALSRLDAEAMMRECEPDVRFESRITALEAESYVGRAGVTEFMARLAEVFEWIETELLELWGRDETIVTRAVMRGRGRGSGGIAEQRFFQVITLAPSRLVAGWRIFLAQDEAFAAAGFEAGERPRHRLVRA